MRLLVIEDERDLCEDVAKKLRLSGYEADTCFDGEAALELLAVEKYDLVLLDLNLPGMGGFQICRELKQKSSRPVLVLTSRDQLQDELHALDLGADEFLTKPCRKERLLARVSNVLKRYEGRNNLLEGNGFLLDRQTYTLYIHNQSVILAQNQGKILEIFLEHGSDIVTKEELCIALWGTAEFIDENALQVNLTRLKKTMANLDMPQQILPVRGVGYRFVGQTLER